jgi:hypothetical protein
MLNIFTDNWMEPPILQEGDRMLHIDTGNPMDNLFVIVDDRVEDVDQEIRLALRRKHGRNYTYRGYEDVTDLYSD